ncbi:MAG: Fic family protein [Balneolaceae bacterium]
MKVYAEAASLSEIVHPITKKEIRRLLRHINSYYSNRIEGEHTTPVDIEKAVKKEYSTDESKKRLQELNVAHIEVQKEIDSRFEKGEDIAVCSADFLCWIHKEFYNKVSETFLRISNNDEIISMKPGELRNRNVAVGNHVAPNADTLVEFLEKFEEYYAPENLYGHKKLIAAAASHQRLTWIHPFLDGNGRVTRLFAYAYMRKVGIESHGLWTLSRGLARTDDYKQMLAIADSPRKGDYDGRGNLSEEGLAKFCSFFFETAHDQITFMKTLLSLDGLLERINGYINLRSQNTIPNEPVLRPEARFILIEVMMRGEVPRGEAQRLTGLGERTARDLTSQLLDEELVVSESHRSSLRFNIPAKVVGYYFPALYPEGSI